MNKTISDEACVDTFLYDVLQAEDYCIEWDKKDVFQKQSNVAVHPLSTPTPELIEEWRSKGLLPTLGDKLSGNDKTLLEEYVPKLFNTILEPKEHLADAIYTLTVLIRSYRNAKQERTYFESQFDDYKRTKDKHSKTTEKPESIRKNIKQIIQLLCNKKENGAFISPKANDEIIPVLEKLYKNPEEYILMNPRYTISKSPISAYLRGLNLPDKSDAIKEFMKKI